MQRLIPSTVSSEAGLKIKPTGKSREEFLGRMVTVGANRLFIFFYIFSFISEDGERRVRNFNERIIDQLPPECPTLEMEPTTQTCAMIGN